MIKLLALKNVKGEVIRFFRCETDCIYLVYREHKKRLDFCSSLDFFGKEPVLLVDEFRADEIQTRFVPGMDAVIEPYRPEDKIRKAFLSPSVLRKDSFQKVFMGVSVVYIFLAVWVHSFSNINHNLKQASIQQNVVEIEKLPKSFVKVWKAAVISQSHLNSTVRKSKDKVVKKSLKQVGVLSALGSLSKDQLTKGGLNLTAGGVSAGPGFRFVAGEGSGGAQSRIYSEGMIASALGAGGNIRGGGGYGTKGANQGGGGSAGYGELSLIGSGGKEGLSDSHTLSSSGSGLDFNIINREILKKRSLIRACYFEALKTEPNLKGFFEFYFQINRQGRVALSQLKPSSPVQSSAVSSCIFEVISKIKFPIDLDSKIQVSYSFDLSGLEN